MQNTPKPLAAVEMLNAGLSLIVQSRVEAILHAYEEPYEAMITEMLHTAVLEGIYLGNLRVSDLAQEGGCPLCGGTGRIGDDIPCWRCEGGQDGR